APHLERGGGRRISGNGNGGASRRKGRSSCSRGQERQHSLHALQVERPPEPAFKQPSSKEGLRRVKQAEDRGEPWIPPDHEIAGGCCQEDSNGQGQACLGTQ